jgi:hypothetical protein
LTPLIAQLGVTAWECYKPRDKSFGFLHFEVEDQATRFMREYDAKLLWSSKSTYRIRFEKSKTQDGGRQLKNTLRSNQLQAQQEPWYDLEKNNAISNLSITQQKPYTKEQKSTFDINFIQCGYYDYNDEVVEFCPIVPLGSGRIIFGNCSSAILINSPEMNQNWQYRIDIDHWTVNLIVLSRGDSNHKPSLVLSMRQAPRMFERAQNLTLPFIPDIRGRRAQE